MKRAHWYHLKPLRLPISTPLHPVPSEDPSLIRQLMHANGIPENAEGNIWVYVLIIVSQLALTCTTPSCASHRPATRMELTLIDSARRPLSPSAQKYSCIPTQGRETPARFFPASLPSLPFRSTLRLRLASRSPILTLSKLTLGTTSVSRHAAFISRQQSPGTHHSWHFQHTDTRFQVRDMNTSQLPTCSQLPQHLQNKPGGFL
jgi:hypothetical protein